MLEDELQDCLVRGGGAWIPYVQELFRRLEELEGSVALRQKVLQEIEPGVSKLKPRLSKTVCARKGCTNFLTVSQAKTGKFCSQSCAAKNRWHKEIPHGMRHGTVDGLNIVAGEGTRPAS